MHPNAYDDNSIGIPKRLGHIWIGPFPPPLQWMETWKDFHPDWQYTLYDNAFLQDFDFRTRSQIEEYIRRGDYAGVADLMRLEILYKFGGLLPEADSICLRRTDELFPRKGIYTVYENEFVRGQLVSPLQAATPRNHFVHLLIEKLAAISPEQLDEPWISTGNLFTAKMIKQHTPTDLTIFPSHYFIPIHFTGIVYADSGIVYAKQMFGSTRGIYNTLSFRNRLYTYISRLAAKRYKKKRVSRARIARFQSFSKFHF